MNTGDRIHYQIQIDSCLGMIADSLDLQHRVRGELTDSGTVQLYWSGKYGPPIGNAIGIDALENLGVILCDLFSMHEEEQADVQGTA